MKKMDEDMATKRRSNLLDGMNPFEKLTNSHKKPSSSTSKNANNNAGFLLKIT